jgi:hypothetical protein
MKNNASPDVTSILALGIFRIYLLYREFSRTEDESRNFGLLSFNSQLMVPNLTAAVSRDGRLYMIISTWCNVTTMLLPESAVFTSLKKKLPAH